MKAGYGSLVSRQRGLTEGEDSVGKIVVFPLVKMHLLGYNPFPSVPPGLGCGGVV